MTARIVLLASHDVTLKSADSLQDDRNKASSNAVSGVKRTERYNDRSCSILM